MLIYKGKILTKFKDKKGGKNKGEVDGFYRDTDGVEYFVKKPKDLKELFTELFAGLLIQEFIRRQLIDKIYQASFVCAQLIQFEDGSYGLIQPKIEFKELYKIIGTGYRDGSDRDPLIEMFYGPESYLLLTQLKSHFGLAIALMYSLLLGDHSVHSGNVVCLDVISAVEMMYIQFARIDWGAAFRYFGHKNNNENLLLPFEYQGLFNHKGYTKGYFLNYKKIKGLFPAIAEQASLLQKKVNDTLFIEMINSVLLQLPANLLDNKIKSDLATYMCIKSFATINFGAGDQQFARDLSDILVTRLKKITGLQDLPSVEGSYLPQMPYVENIPTVIGLSVNNIIPFNQQMSLWLNILSLTDERSIFDFESIDRILLAKQYNTFVENLARQMGRLEQCLDDDAKIFLLDHSEALPIRTLFHNRFTLDVDLKPCSSSREQAITCKQTFSQLAEAVLTTGFNVIITIRVMQGSQSTSMHVSASAFHFLFVAIKKYLQDFNEVPYILNKELQEILFSLSGLQLVRICLEEMQFINSSLLIGIILKSPELWSRMDRAFIEESEFIPQEKINNYLIQLRRLHEDYTLFLTLASELLTINQLFTKGVVVEKLRSLFEGLPECLQMELAPILHQIQDELRGLQRRHSRDLEEGREKELLLEKSSDALLDKNDSLIHIDEKEISIKNMELFEKISADKILWDAIAESQNEELPLDDLFLLKNFYDRKREDCIDGYGEALNIFYSNALKIRLSNKSSKEQANILISDANKLFDSSKKSTILDEVNFLIKALYGKVTDAKLKTINKSLFFNQHTSDTLTHVNNQDDNYSLSSSHSSISSNSF